jgi:hypothetical protein
VALEARVEAPPKQVAELTERLGRNSGNSICRRPANHLLPVGAARTSPVRASQWVLTFPFAWRRRLAQDGALLSTLKRLLVDTVHSFYAKRAAVAGGISASAAKSGAVTVVQRTSLDLRLNRTCTWCSSTAPITSKGHSSCGTRWDIFRRVKSAKCCSAWCAASTSTYAATACSMGSSRMPSLKTPRTNSQPQPSRDKLRQRVRSGVAALRRCERQRSATTSPCAHRSLASLCTPPLARVPSIPRAAKGGCATCCGHRSRKRIERRPEGLVRSALKRAFGDGTLAVEHGPSVSAVPARHQRAPTSLSHREVRRRTCAGQRVAQAHQVTARAHRPARRAIRRRAIL